MITPGKTTSSDWVHTFQYDAENRMVSVDAGVTARYTYDSNNWRVKKEAGGVVTHYVWEGGQVIAEYEFGGGNTSGAGVRYYEPDRLSTRVITNGSGAVVGTLDQLPFGEEVGTAGESEKHKFTSYERDSETGTDYAVNRQYQNALGRFMRPDPYGGSMSITDPQSFNRYTYVGNDPVNASDPLGLQQDPPLVIDVEDPPPAPQQPIESNDTLVVNTNEPGSGGGGFGFGFGGLSGNNLFRTVDDNVIGGLVDADGGGGDFFTPPVPLVPEPPPAPPQTQRDCDFPSFDQLSSAQQGLLGGADAYNRLAQDLMANFLNQTGALAKAGINLGDATLQAGGILPDRLLFAPGESLRTFRGSIEAAIVSGGFIKDTPVASKHPGMSDFGARQNRTFNALQVGFGLKGGAFVDIDRGNPRTAAGAIVHLGELITPGKTDPFAVGSALGKGVTGYNCK